MKGAALAASPSVVAGSLAAACLLLGPAPARAAARTLELRFVPAARAQMAIWIEKPDGTFMGTVRLTQAVSVRGIGNRPGAAQMNSGFRWPYGRREGVLPVWAHRRAAAPGAAQFRRVIFQDRLSEGFASRTTEDSSVDSYFCLSFKDEYSRRDALDATSCASPYSFNSDKGRYWDELRDLPDGYDEPAVIAGEPTMRALDGVSLYPPRRDVIPCSTCYDTADVRYYAADARAVMPDIDAVTMATPPGGVEQTLLFTAPDAWPDGPYVLFAEVNVEGDYNAAFNDTLYPTPTLPAGKWDTWAIDFGYPFRGQPSVVYAVPFALGAAQTAGTSVPAGYGDVDGFGPGGGALHPLDAPARAAGVITDAPGDPATAGSGADRLRLGTSVGPGAQRLTVVVRDRSQCEDHQPPAVPAGLSVEPVADGKHSHQWGRLGFTVPASDRPIALYEVRYARDPIVPGDPLSFERALPAMAATVETEALMVPNDRGAGADVEVAFGGMEPLTHYWVAARAVDACNLPGPFAVAELTTTRVNFTQLSGCFVATAAYGSALEPEVEALRAARDAVRGRSVLAAAAVDLYYRSGPAAAAVLADSNTARAVVRSLLAPVVEIARAVTGAGAP